MTFVWWSNVHGLAPFQSSLLRCSFCDIMVVGRRGGNEQFQSSLLRCSFCDGETRPLEKALADVVSILFTEVFFL